MLSEQQLSAIEDYVSGKVVGFVQPIHIKAMLVDLWKDFKAQEVDFERLDGEKDSLNAFVDALKKNIADRVIKDLEKDHEFNVSYDKISHSIMEIAKEMTAKNQKIEGLEYQVRKLEAHIATLKASSDKVDFVGVHILTTPRKARRTLPAYDKIQVTVKVDDKSTTYDTDMVEIDGPGKNGGVWDRYK